MKTWRNSNPLVEGSLFQQPCRGCERRGEPVPLRHGSYGEGPWDGELGIIECDRHVLGKVVSLGRKRDPGDLVSMRRGTAWVPQHRRVRPCRRHVGGGPLWRRGRARLLLPRRTRVAFIFPLNDRASTPGVARLELPPQLRWSLHRGETDPILGWYSRGLGQRIPAFTLLGLGQCVPGAPLTARLVFLDVGKRQNPALSG